MSVNNKPLLERSKKLFAKILSINVAVCEVILEGRVIKGKTILEYIPSRNWPVRPVRP